METTNITGAKILRWIGVWLIVQTFLHGLIGWYVGFGVLFRDAEITYTPSVVGYGYKESRK